MSRVVKIALILSLLGNISIGYVGYKAIKYREYLNYWLDRYTRVVEEFSGRNVYSEANSNLSKVEPTANRIVFLGTQVIKNWELSADFSEYEAINRGIDSQRVAGYLLRFVPDVVELRPRAVVIEVSSYNFRPQWTTKELKDYISSLADLAVANKIMPMFGAVIPPLGGAVDYENYRTADSITAFNNWLKSKADSWIILPFDSLLSQAPAERFYSSALQPSRRGYELMAGAVKSAFGRLE